MIIAGRFVRPGAGVTGEGMEEAESQDRSPGAAPPAERETVVYPTVKKPWYFTADGALWIRPR
jgi:hypothetical protein